MSIRFEWDPAKDLSNLRKHGLSFATALRAFADPLAVSLQDRIEGGERRWQTVGLVDGYLLIVVAHTLRMAQDTEVIRIISARRATRMERKSYENQSNPR